MNLLSVFTNLPIQDIYINGTNNMWSFGNAFFFQFTLSFKDSTTLTNLNDIATDTQGTVWMSYRDLHSMPLVFSFVPSLDSVHHTFVNSGHTESSVFLKISHTTSHLHVLSYCTSNSCIQNNLTVSPLYTQYSSPFNSFWLTIRPSAWSNFKTKKIFI